MIAKTYGGAVVGIDAVTIRVETCVEPGVNFMLVGLPDNAVRESHYRVASALQHCGYPVPVKKIIINMAPADMRKEGAAYDLTLAIGILSACGRFDSCSSEIWPEDYMIMGELSLDGILQPIKGVLSLAEEAQRKGFKGIIVPRENASEAALVEGLPVYGAVHLLQVIGFFQGKGSLVPFQSVSRVSQRECPDDDIPDFNEVKGQCIGKRAMEIAAAGGHNVIMVGPPGAGKTMLARRLPGILPPLGREEALETTKIYSVAGLFRSGEHLISYPPFRDPHHTVSYVSLVGGGSYPLPGEISLAHNGVLFLDEIAEFPRATLEVLRQPLEDRKIALSRARMKVDYPAGFMLVASMNPCPCGFYNSPDKPCTCRPSEMERYRNKLSGPLLDRMDLHVQVLPLSHSDLSGTASVESSKDIRKRVVKAREVQRERFRSIPVRCNAQMKARHVADFCTLDAESARLLETAMKVNGFSARTYHRILKVARTIADLDGSVDIASRHIAEALHFRCMDRSDWGR